MDFDIQIFHSVMEIGPTAWDQLGKGQPFTSSRWYCFGEAVFSDCSPTYVTLSQGNEPLAGSVFWVKRQEWLPIGSSIARFGAEELLRRRPLLMCAAPLACTPGWFLPESSLRAAAVKTISETALEIGAKHRASFVSFSYIPEADVQQGGWPEDFSAISFTDEDTCLEISWPDFDSYLMHLAKSTRRNHRLHAKQADEMGVVVTAHSTVTDIDRAIPLIWNVERFHRAGRRPWTRSVLENAHLVDSTWITAHIGERLVGCCLVIGDGPARIATLLGLDYSVPQYIYVYYQIIYAAIRSAIEQGAEKLYGGGGAYELKRRLGFRVLPNDYLVVAAAGKSFRWIERKLAKWAGLQNAGEKAANATIDPDRVTEDAPDGY
ncbi:MAG TPA: GNAT family N-acetyltransferase [Anaerolineales bacterium]|nr:GNAT family N-acetyltransferase [Anaerolineales bacterium]